MTLHAAAYTLIPLACAAVVYQVVLRLERRRSRLAEVLAETAGDGEECPERPLSDDEETAFAQIKAGYSWTAVPGQRAGQEDL